jgi:hypothetical protein
MPSTPKEKITQGIAISLEVFLRELEKGIGLEDLENSVTLLATLAIFPITERMLHPGIRDQ